MVAPELAQHWLAPNISFALLTVMVLVSAAFAAFSANIVRAAYSLFFTLLGMAGYYVLLGSGFLAITQVIIYVGGILVLLMFGVLLTERPSTKAPGRECMSCIFCSLVGASFLFIILARIIYDTPWQIVDQLSPPAEPMRSLGRLLLGEYLLVLEVCGMTLLLCLIGAAYLVRRREP